VRLVEQSVVWRTVIWVEVWCWGFDVWGDGLRGWVWCFGHFGVPSAEFFRDGKKKKVVIAVLDLRELWGGA